MGQHLSVPPSSYATAGGHHGSSTATGTLVTAAAAAPNGPAANATNASSAIGGGLLAELGAEIGYDKSMGASRFLKTIRARHRSGALVVKVFVKDDPGLSFRPFEERIKLEREALSQGANVLAYQRAVETDRATYLVRQWMASNLYDRISTRPFLTSIEKKWIAFQLLMGLRYAHERGISHGDIKTENVLCTSWSWALLTDFSSAFKPTYLPLDDPSTFSYYFDTSSRRTCYLAPERFYTPDSEIARQKATLGWGQSDGPVTEAMDVFSLGCVMAEMWMEGTPPFTLSQLFKYREEGTTTTTAVEPQEGERYSLEPYLNEIEDVPMRDLVRSMVSRQPSQRKSCKDYLDESKGTVFPEVFYTFLHPFLAGLNEGSSIGAEGGMNVNPASTGITTTTLGGETLAPRSMETSTSLRSDSDDKIERVWNEWEMVMQYLEDDLVASTIINKDANVVEPTPVPGTPAETFPVLLDVPGLEASPAVGGTLEDGPALILLSLLCSNLRNCVRPSSVLRCLDLLLALSRCLTDETKLDRLVPYLVATLGDDAPMVRSAAIRSLTQVLLTIDSVTPLNASIYTEYILPNMRPLATDDSLLVRSTYATCLPSLATQGKLVLDTNQALQTTSSAAIPQPPLDDLPEPYDLQLLTLHQTIQDHLHPLLSDPDPLVRRSLLSHIGELCTFFGPHRANDAVLAHLVTYLNSREWRLREAWNKGAGEVAKVVGGKSWEMFLAPLMVLSLADKEEFVTVQVLTSLTSLMRQGLITKVKKWELVGLITGFLCHPNIWIREGAASFLASTSDTLDPTDRWCILYPTIKRLLRADIKEITALSILDNAREPLSRVIFEAAVSWAGRAGKSHFWSANGSSKNATREKGAPRDVGVRTDEDQAQLDKMRQLGMKFPDDEVKLNLMRDYISRLAVARQANPTKSTEPTSSSTLDPITHHPATVLQDLGIIPETIFFNIKNDESSAPTDRSTSGLPRRFSLEPSSTPRSVSEFSGLGVGVGASPDGRGSRSRQVLGTPSSTTGQIDDLRRRLAQTSLEGTTVPPLIGPSPLRHPQQRTVSETSSIKTHVTESSTTTTTTSGTRVQKNLFEVGKVGAEVGEDLANAQGRFEVALGTSQVRREGAMGIGLGESPSGGQMKRPSRLGKVQQQRFETTYTGSEAGVKQLLERAYLETYREPIADFGPHVPVGIPRRKALRTAFPPRDRTPAKPEGTLIAHLVEHTAAITSIAVSPDQLFFVTGSQDGTVKVWDSIRLEKNVTSKSRQTFDQGGRITCVGVVEHTRCVVSASDNGSVWVHRVDVALGGSMPRYGRAAMVRQCTMQGRVEFVTCLDSYITETTTNLIVGTSLSTIQILDLRTMRPLHTWQNPSHLGPISSLCFDRKKVWLVVGTAHGFLSLWDLRFGLLLRSWSISPSSHRIERIAVHPTKGKGRWIIVSVQDSLEAESDVHAHTSTTPHGTTQIAEVWDLERALKVEEFRVSSPSTVGASTSRNAAGTEGSRANKKSGTAIPSTPVFRAKEAVLDPSKAIAILLEQATNKRNNPNGVKLSDVPAIKFDETTKLTTSSSMPSKLTVRALWAGVDYSHTVEGVTASSSHPGGLHLLDEASSSNEHYDRTGAKGGSSGAAGFLLTAGEDRKVRYWDLGKASQSTIVSGQELEEETAVFTLHSSTTRPSIYLESHPPSQRTSRVHRSTLIANHQQQLLRAHHDAITALAIVDLPFRCIITGDRSGVVKVFE
ncbi:BZ3500_MvSof-1268-A1-R1_Chr3-2g06260 [Microbotryum saponariae]|uniref:non-specific serine/threonine protein kinase n=1 Tax=Microbotryum saponariae TaxID=289078 RepID=A0A2X0KYQ2_9BASI|nr:BZ3500_MvSof-1268-A1-R1_Chr3-2g06260 [Microbotryum saponariae]SDA04220.1 BZ3501_MvSof-1269-A2-R1_Chr3-2g05951 [Microbotryum saponariae]